VVSASADRLYARLSADRQNPPFEASSGGFFCFAIAVVDAA
jgi:hypothetical protein